MIKMKLPHLIERRVKIVLKNSFYYRGKLVSDADDILEIVDETTHNRVFLDASQVAAIEEIGGGQ